MKKEYIRNRLNRKADDTTETAPDFGALVDNFNESLKDVNESTDIEKGGTSQEVEDMDSNLGLEDSSNVGEDLPSIDKPLETPSQDTSTQDIGLGESPLLPDKEEKMDTLLDKIDNLTNATNKLVDSMEKEITMVVSQASEEKKNEDSYSDLENADFGFAAKSVSSGGKMSKRSSNEGVTTIPEGLDKMYKETKDDNYGSYNKPPKQTSEAEIEKLTEKDKDINKATDLLFTAKTLRAKRKARLGKVEASESVVTQKVALSTPVIEENKDIWVLAEKKASDMAAEHIVKYLSASELALQAQEVGQVSWPLYQELTASFTKMGIENAGELVSSALISAWKDNSKAIHSAAMDYIGLNDEAFATLQKSIKNTPPLFEKNANVIQNEQETLRRKLVKGSIPVVARGAQTNPMKNLKDKLTELGPKPSKR